MPISTIIDNPTNGVRIACQSWVGYIHRVRYQGEVFHRLGRTGAGSQTVGLRADISSCEALYVCATAAIAATTRASFLALSLETVFITDDFGERVRCMVHSVVPIIKAGRYAYAGVMYPYAVHAQLTVEDVGAGPTADSNTVPA